MLEEQKTAESFDAWAIVEVMGHKVVAGRVTEQVIAGQGFVRVDVNEDQEAAVADQLKTGALVRASEQVVRLFGSDAATLRLLAGVGGEKVYVEFF